MTEAPRILRVGEEPPPLHLPAGRPRRADARDGDGGKGAPGGAKAAGAGRFALLNSFVDLSMAELRRAELAVWLVLFRDSRDGTASTPQSDIARRASCDARTVRRAIERLDELHLVEVLYRGGLQRGPSRYRVRGGPPAK